MKKFYLIFLSLICLICGETKIIASDQEESSTLDDVVLQTLLAQSRVAHQEMDSFLRSAKEHQASGGSTGQTQILVASFAVITQNLSALFAGIVQHAQSLTREVMSQRHALSGAVSSDQVFASEARHQKEIASKNLTIGTLAGVAGVAVLALCTLIPTTYYLTRRAYEQPTRAIRVENDILSFEELENAADTLVQTTPQVKEPKLKKTDLRELRQTLRDSIYARLGV